MKAARETAQMVERIRPDVAVADIMTPAASLAAEVAGVPVATLVPHVHPHMAPGFPIYSIGARLPRTRLGARLWERATARFVQPALEQGRDQFNESRRRLGLPPVPWVHTGLSRECTLVATLPQLEYPREWPPWAKVVGPLMWEPPAERVEPPPGDGPVVLVAPSTAQDAEHRLLRAALEGLAGEPVRVIATWNGREPDPPIACPDNAVLVPWLSYSQTMPACDVVVCHGGHGTLVRALTNGCPGRRLPRGRRHGRERLAGRLGGPRRPAAAPLRDAARRAGGRRAACCGSRGSASARARWRAGRRSTTAVRGRSTSSRPGPRRASERPRRPARRRARGRSRVARRRRRRPA